jgi:hypothetical protein
MHWMDVGLCVLEYLPKWRIPFPLSKRPFIITKKQQTPRT